METSFFPPRKSSLSPPRSVPAIRPTIPANLNISTILSFGKQQQQQQHPQHLQQRHAVSPVRRKPLPPNSPALVTNQNTTVWKDNSKLSPLSTRTSSEVSSPLVVRDLDQFPRGHSPLLISAPLQRKPVGSARREPLLVPSSLPDTNPTDQPAGAADISHQRQRSDADRMLTRSRTTASQPSHKPPPLRMNTHDGHLTQHATDSKQPQTPGSKLTQFFGWKGRSSPKEDDSASSTDTSDHGLSPLPSPLVVSPQTSRYSARSFPHGVDTYKSTSDTPHDDGFRSPLNSSILDPELSAKVGQLEGELKEITCELAGSIKREMDLEDLVESLQSEISGSSDDTRTSDYYSDSSTNSARYAAMNRSLKLEDFEKVKRDAEQQKAQSRLDLSHKWQEERSRRLMSESHLQSLESQVTDYRKEHTELASLIARSKEVEASLAETRSRLAEERHIKEKFEKLATSLRSEAERHRAERNKFRDDIVPQLQAKLLSKNIPPTSPSFDFNRMKEEMEVLRNENTTLREARKGYGNARHSLSQFNTISEEGEPLTPSLRSPIGLSRSNSLARAPARTSGLARSGSLSRSNSIGKSPVEPREALVDRMKDVELQRDALHAAMKALLARQDSQTQAFQKQIRNLKQEVDRAKEPPTPRRQGYQKEVHNLREEINQLRRRADDAFAQKLQCEKGLGGLKMDLDRSEQETNTLRDLLTDHDVALPAKLSDSLQRAYHQLQQDHQNAEAQLGEDPYPQSLEEEQELAEQLRQSAERSEGLARQMSSQLATNQALRNRLAQAIGKGERDQVASGEQITELESHLHQLEDTVNAAQQQSETAVVQHEEEIRILKEAHSAQLHRLKASGPLSPSMANPTGRRGPSPLISPIFAQRSPKIDQTTSGQGLRLDEVLKTEQLEKKVKELEMALENADQEMQQVVGRMNSAQIEVMELQTERDEAMRQTRKLEAAIMAEREKVQSLVNTAQQL